MLGFINSRLLLGLVPASALVLTAASARADDSSAAQALYNRALQLMTEKNYADACPKLKEVTRLVPEGLGAKLTLAECYEADGKLASAWSQYSVVESIASRSGQEDRQRAAAEKAAALRPRLAMLTIKVPDAVKEMPELVLKRDGEPVGPPQFGEPIPIDAGKHLVEATARGKKKWSLETTIPADGAELAVEVAILEDDPAARLDDPPPGEAPTDSQPTWLFPVGFAVGGTGVAALIVGGILGGLALSDASAGDDACPASRCTQEGNDLQLSAGTFADASTGLFIAGGVLTAGGVLMIILAPQDDAETASGSDEVSVRLAPFGLGAALTGKF